MRRAMVFLGVVSLGVTLALATVSVAQEPGNPVIGTFIHLEGNFAARGWTPGTELTVTADDPATPESPDIIVTVPVDWSGGCFEDLLPGLEAGWTITATDGVVTKTHTVTNVLITDVDPTTDIMRGTAEPFTQVYVVRNRDGDEGNRWVEADAGGEWSIDYSAEFDITPGADLIAVQYDGDGDYTLSFWHVPRPEDWQHNPATGHDYIFVGEGMSWADAEAYAVSLGGHLVTINDAAEDEWLVSTFGTEYWIGLNDIAVEGEWVWASGEPVSYTNWCPGEPNDLEPGEDAVMIWNRPPIGWNDIPDDSLMPFVVEIAAPVTLDELLDDMVGDGRLPNEGVATSIIRQAEKAPLKALTNHLRSLVYDGVITQQTMDQILAMVAS